jgi:hypothetical protein
MGKTAVVLLCLLLPAPVPDSDLEAPFRLEAGGKPIDVLGGHAAPALADLDGDGVRDLLVGQFLGEGKNPFETPMRLYRNGGTEKAPRFGAAATIEGGGVPASVPTG